MRRLIAVLLVLMMAQACAAEAGEIENYTRYTDYVPQAAEPVGLIPGTDHSTLVAWFSRVGNTVFDPEVDVVSTASLQVDASGELTGNAQMIAGWVQEMEPGAQVIAALSVPGNDAPKHHDEVLDYMNSVR